MMDLGSGIAIGGFWIAAAPVAIVALRTFNKPPENREGGDGRQFPCREHSGIVQCLEGIEKTQDRQEKWLSEISGDVKRILTR
jgi:hypothetical protein